MEIVAFYVGLGTETSAKIILEKLEKIRIKYICTDGNFAYQNIAPKGTQHIISKAETCLVESFNARLRHYIVALADEQCAIENLEIFKHLNVPYIKT